MTEAETELLKLLREAYAHLEYCGYGDSWERECALDSKLDVRIEKVLDKYEGQL